MPGRNHRAAALPSTQGVHARLRPGAALLHRGDVAVGELPTNVVGMGRFVRILTAVGRGLQPAQLLVHMVVAVPFDEGDVVVMAMT